MSEVLGVIYLAVGGLWLFVCALGLAMAWGERSLERTLARALVLTPVWPVAAVWAIVSAARPIWRATEWGSSASSEEVGNNG